MSICVKQKTPMKKLARTCHVSTSTFSGAIIEDLDMKSDSCQRPTLMIKPTKETRTGRTSKAPKMLILPEKEAVTFVTEKNFTVDEGINLQN